MTGRTPSQTVGPYFAICLPWEEGNRVGFAGNPGTPVVIEGRVLDGNGSPVNDALVETWQLGADGKPPQPATGASRPHGFSRVPTAPDGSFRIETTMPGGATPYLGVIVLARGLLRHLHTRVYLAPEADVRKEPLLRDIAASPRLATLVARPSGPGVFHWDVRLQGEGETVFFAA